MIDYQVNAIHIFVLKSQHLWSIYQITIQHCNHNVFAVLGLAMRCRYSNDFPVDGSMMALMTC